MKNLIIKILFVMSVILLIPYFMTIYFSKKEDSVRYSNLEDMLITYLDKAGEQKILDMETYIKGVTAASMPVNYNIEALKAQAVLSRTDAYGRISFLRKSQNKSAVTTVEIGLTYIDEDEIKTLIGDKNSSQYLPVLKEAVELTAGEIIENAEGLNLPLGVNKLAENGKDYKTILTYYSPESKILKINY